MGHTEIPHEVVSKYEAPTPEHKVVVEPKYIQAKKSLTLKVHGKEVSVKPLNIIKPKLAANIKVYLYIISQNKFISIDADT